MNVVGGIIEKNGRYLIAQRKRGDTYELCWEFPGGKVRENETPETALKRELLEELELDVVVQDFLGSCMDSDSYGLVQLHYYRVKVSSGSYTLNAHEQIKWVTLAEMSQYDLLECDKDIVKQLINAIDE
ncbi:MAG: NUDIX domain-containing protein [Candidatus Bathyarchaeota archaeon]|nr:NUDIX domain-containing protein [Candidatus Bathyarchaeota archaeon]